VSFRPKGRGGPDLLSAFHAPIKTDSQGRFQVGALPPDLEFRLSDGQGQLGIGAVGAGQTKELGDVIIKPFQSE
jgi:hypothetical protein